MTDENERRSIWPWKRPKPDMKVEELEEKLRRLEREKARKRGEPLDPGD